MISCLHPCHPLEQWERRRRYEIPRLRVEQQPGWHAQAHGQVDASLLLGAVWRLHDAKPASNSPARLQPVPRQRPNQLTNYEYYEYAHPRTAAIIVATHTPSPTQPRPTPCHHLTPPWTWSL